MLRAYVAMMPVLQAREALRGSSIAAYASGQMRKANAERLRAEWDRTARQAQGWSSGRRLDLGRMTPEQAAAAVRSIGFDISFEGMPTPDVGVSSPIEAGATP